MAGEGNRERERRRTTDYRAPGLASTLRGPPERMDFSRISFIPREQLFPSALHPALSPAPPRRTLAGMPFQAAKPAPDFSKPDFWGEFGLSLKDKRKQAAPARAEPADIRDELAVWSVSLPRPNAPMCVSFIKEVEAQFSTLSSIKAPGGTAAPGRLETLCTGSRATYGEEESVAVAVATAVDNIKRSFKEIGCRSQGGFSEFSFIKQLVRAILSTPMPVESCPGSEVEIRNGFYRSVAWCLCMHNQPSDVFSCMSNSAISLLDGIGIAAGLNTAEVGEGLAKDLLYLLFSKRWVSTAFSKMQENIRVSASKGELHDMDMVELLETLFSELDRYQDTVQSFSKIAVLMHNLKNHGKNEETSPLYLDSNSFHRLLSTRSNPEGTVWKDLGRLHKLVSDKLASTRFPGAGKHEAPRPRDIAYMFTTILEGLDFLSENQAIRDSAMRVMQHYGVLNSNSGPGTFRRIFAMCMFTCREDLERYKGLYQNILNDEDPINYVIATEHMGRISGIRSARPSEPPRLSMEEIRAFADDDSPL